jgi:hypothetical protein
MALPERPEALEQVDYDLLLSLADKVVKRGLSVPTIFFLESSKPLSYIGSQAMVFFGPFVRILFESPNYYRYSEMLEERSNVELLLQMIEEREAERSRAEKEARDARKAEGHRPRWKFWSRKSS